jgi:Fe-S-cluster containining protein
VKTNCEGCAGCCLDWRPLGGAPDRERRGRYHALDDTYNLVPLTSDEIRTFLDAGEPDALAPRLFTVHEDAAGSDTDRAGATTVEIDGYDVAAVGDRPLFAVGLRKTAKPVALFGRRNDVPQDDPENGPVWLDACVFLDPDTLQCRIHEAERYPRTCGTYPGHNLELDAETECERIEDAHGEAGERLLEDTPPEDLPPLPFGPQALGGTVFLYPDPNELSGVVERIADGEPTPADRARFVGVAVGSAPGSPRVNEQRRAEATQRARETESWISEAISEWRALAGDHGTPAWDAPESDEIEEARGAPETPGWDAVEEK